MVYAILIGYIALTFLTSLRGARAKNSTPEGYFMANRSLNTTALFFTIIATNFSAFYFLGYAGEGYRTGYAYATMMAFGTAFACLSFFFIGEKVWSLGKSEGYVTPSELVIGQTGSRSLGMVFTAIMTLGTFPYLALQLIGAGYLLENMTGGEVPYLLGASALTLFTILYVLIGGMSSIASTDMKQGLLMMVLMLAAVVWITQALGGMQFANEQVRSLAPELFRRSGGEDIYTPHKWFSLLIFWLFCIPMFPQIFMRFFIARDLPTLRKSTILYAAIPLLLSLLPVIIGVVGHLSFSGLEDQAADEILPKMLVEHCPEWFAALVMTGALAAFMSTLDSQLLALSTMIARDVMLPFNPGMSHTQQVRLGRVWVMLLALIGLAIAWQPFSTIFDMGKLGFSGLAMLFPACVIVLYCQTVRIHILVPIILTSLGILTLAYYELIPGKLFLGFEPAVVLVFIQSMILYITHRKLQRRVPEISSDSPLQSMS